MHATEVFTPTDVPTHTYVERSTKDFERELRQAFSIPKMIVSISGPSKSGKTTLVTKVIAPENLIHIYGASIQRPEDLWSNVIAWMGGPLERLDTDGSRIAGDISSTMGGKAGLPLIAEGKIDVRGSATADATKSSTSKYVLNNLEEIVREIGSSDFVVFVDDFHYIEKSVRDEIGKQIKAAAEKGVRICTASVPHKADDVVRSNSELRGRVTAIDMDYWQPQELQEIAMRGFTQLNAVVDRGLILEMAAEAFGSPQLMQTICLNFCFVRHLDSRSKDLRTIAADGSPLKQVFGRSTAATDFSTMLKALHAGPKQRGTERKQFEFTDGSAGDVYRCVLLAIKMDPSGLTFRYDQMLRRTHSICIGESPVGSSVSESLTQMAKIAEAIQVAPVLDWSEDVLDIVEPYFLFFLRNSPLLDRLGRKPSAQEAMVL